MLFDPFQPWIVCRAKLFIVRAERAYVWRVSRLCLLQEQQKLRSLFVCKRKAASAATVWAYKCIWHRHVVEVIGVAQVTIERYAGRPVLASQHFLHSKLYLRACLTRRPPVRIAGGFA